MISLEKIRKNEARGAKAGPLAQKEERAAYLFLLPWLVGLLVFLVIPILSSLGLSFTNLNLMSPPEWVGFNNYRAMAVDSNFLNSIKVTLKYTVL